MTQQEKASNPAPVSHLEGTECQYAKDQGTPEHHCAVRCVYEDQTIGHPEARSVLWNFAINACAAMIENNIIMDTSTGKVLAPRQDGNRDGLHYATAIRGLAAAEGQKATLQSEPIADDSLQAQIGGIGNQIHNLGCEHHNNEELAERLGELASSLWSIAASVSDPARQTNLVGLPQDVINLVIAARIVAYGDRGLDDITALDKAVEAFAERVEWENDPEAIATMEASDAG